MNVPVNVCHSPMVTPVGEQRLYERKEGVHAFDLAYYDGEQLPTASAFETFQGYDYSRDGFGYWTQETPPSNLAVVRLFYNGKVQYHEARIMHTRNVERNGEQCFLVGCKFSIRITPSSIAADS